MSPSSTALVPTANASRYLQQLCKHRQHNLAVEFDAKEGRVTFPKNALVTMTAEDGALLCRIAASAPGQLEGLKGAARHLDRFAFRVAPLTWLEGRLT
jgi:hypothetical protein